MGLNGIRILEGTSLSPIKRQRKQNMQMFVILAPLRESGGHHAASR